MADAAEQGQDKAEQDDVATEILKSFVDRKQAQGAATEKRKQHYAEAVDKADNFWADYDMEDIERRVQDYQERTGSGFRTGSGLSFMPDTHQYPFIEVSPGIHMTIRERTDGEYRRGPRDGGEVTAYQLVVQADGLPGPEHRDRETGDIAGEAVFATIPIRGRAIEYADEVIGADPVLAEAADREVLAQLGAIHEGLLELLDNPEPLLA